MDSRHLKPLQERRASLYDLPHELVVNLCRLLDQHDLLSIGLTSKHYWNAVEPILYRLEDIYVGKSLLTFIRALRRQPNFAQLVHSATFRTDEFDREDVLALCREIGSRGPHTSLLNTDVPEDLDYWGPQFEWTLLLEQVLCLLPNLKELTLVSDDVENSDLLQAGYFDESFHERIPELSELTYINTTKRGSLHFVMELIELSLSLKHLTLDSKSFDDSLDYISEFDSVRKVRLVDPVNIEDDLSRLVRSCPNLTEFQSCHIPQRRSRNPRGEAKNASAEDIIASLEFCQETLESLSLTVSSKEIFPELHEFTSLKHVRLDVEKFVYWLEEDGQDSDDSEFYCDFMGNILLRILPPSIETLWIDGVCDVNAEDYDVVVSEFVILATHRLENLRRITIECGEQPKRVDGGEITNLYEKTDIEIIRKPRRHYWYVEEGLQLSNHDQIRLRTAK